MRARIGTLMASVAGWNEGRRATKPEGRAAAADN